MNFEVQSNDSFTLVKFTRDRLDSFISPDLKAEFVMLSGKGVNNIVLDLQDCKYCDSSGLSAILVGNRICEESEGTFIICNLSRDVDKIIRMAMLDTILLLAKDLDEAKRLLVKKAEL